VRGCIAALRWSAPSTGHNPIARLFSYEYLGPVINTPAREYSPRISPDGKWLIFSSEQGMQTEKRDQPFTAEEFSLKRRGVFNGLGNIYRIPMDYVLRATKP